MHIHILGICGTFMGGVAILARQMGFKVTGSDAGVYPPMSTQLIEQGIELYEGYDADQIKLNPDIFVVGNAMRRDIPVVEEILNRGLSYISGPQFVSEYILKNRWVLAVAGTHGKTTTTSILSWILEAGNLKPGFLVGGVPENFGVSARQGDDPFFVIEADEYDTAFFDKRSKFVHYHPRSVILNNLEFDHADIFENLDAIKKQFHHLMRIVPSNGLVVAPQSDANIRAVLEMGAWTPIEYFGGSDSSGWSYDLICDDGSEFKVAFDGKYQGTVKWSLMGLHNVQNALASIAAARHAGVPPAHAIESLSDFVNVKRRMELRGVVNGISVFDDFAHHPTAVQMTLNGLRNKVGKDKIIAVLEPRSNTMRMGVHQESLAASFSDADEVILFHPAGLEWNFDELSQKLGEKLAVFDSVSSIIEVVSNNAQPGNQVLIMSNGSFENIHENLLNVLERKYA